MGWFFVFIFAFLSSCTTSEEASRTATSSQSKLERAIEEGIGTYKQELAQGETGTALIQQYEKKARAGDLNNQLRLAYIYLNGLGIEPHYRKALYWYEAAAKQNSSLAFYYLGVMAEEGTLALPHYKKAATYYRKALAGEGTADAQFRLGVLYEKGRGVGKNMQTALANFFEAALKNHPPALEKLGMLYAKGENVLQNHATARTFFTRAARLGAPNAFYHLGLFSLEGRGIKKDLERAYVWFNIGAALGNHKAQAELKNLETQIPADNLAALQEEAQEWMDGALKKDGQ